MSPESGYNPEAELEAQKFQVDKTIAFVDASQDNEQRARDIAEAELLEEKENINNERTWKNLVPRLWENFKFTKKYEYARQKKILEAKKRMEETGSWYLEDGGAEDTAKEMEAVIERFVAETEEEARHGEKKQSLEEFFEERQQPEKAQEVKGAVKELISQYATGELVDKAAFIEARNRAFNGIESLPDEIKSQMVGHADNMLNVAESARTAFNHHQSLDKLDLDFDILIAQAKTGVRTKAELNRVDQIVDKLKTSPLGRYIAVPTLSAAVAIGYTGAAVLSQGIARSRTAAWLSMGVGALVGGGFAAAHENKRVKEERAQHGRERAQGKKIKDGSARREQMDQYIGKSIPAKEVAVSMEGLIKQNGEYTKEDIETLAAGIAEIDSRIQFSDRNNIDLIRYSDVKLVEQERRDLDIVRAKAKVELKRLAADGKVEIPKQFGNWENYYRSMVDARSAGFKTEQETTDKQFNRFKTKKVAWAATKAVGIGLVVGGVAQEARALVHPGETGLIEGLSGKDVEYATTPIEALRRWFAGDGGSEAVGSEVNQEMAQFAGGIENDPLFVGDKAMLNPEQYIKEHPSLFQKVHRTLWYDNDTPKPVFDKNELKLWWGGDKNGGVTDTGDYVFDISHMKPNGSYHDQFNVDAQNAMKEGKIKLLLSMSRDTQAQVVELQIGSNGEVIIPKDSETAKIFFEVDNKGNAVFKGRYAEVAEVLGSKDGVDQVRLLATHEGKGVESILNDPVPQVEVGAVPTPEDGPFIYPPPIIPIHSRREMESMAKKDSTPIEDLTPLAELDTGLFEKSWGSYFDYMGGYYGAHSEVDEKIYKERRSKNLEEKDAKLDPSVELNNYVGNLPEEWNNSLEELSEQFENPVDKECKIQVLIPVAGHQEGKNIYDTLKWYARQKNENGEALDPKTFELILFVNHPNDAQPDETLDEINRFKQDYPNLKVNSIYKALDRDQAKIGTIRKMLADLALKRQLDSGVESQDIVLVSNDADCEGISDQYLSNFMEQFKDNPELDAVLGKIDWDPKAYAKSPLLYVGTRLFQYLDAINRHPDDSVRKHVGSSGANFAYKSSIYSAVGGYITDGEIGEDVQLGRMMIAARRGSDTYPIGYGKSKSVIYTNARRGVDAVNHGFAPSEQWDRGFGPDDELRGQQWKFTENGDIAKDLKKPEYISKFKDALEDIVNRTLLNSYRINPASKEAKKALGLLGIEYKVVNGSVKLGSINKLISQLNSYQEEYTKIYDRQVNIEKNVNSQEAKDLRIKYPNVKFGKELNKLSDKDFNQAVENFEKMIEEMPFSWASNDAEVILGTRDGAEKGKIELDITRPLRSMKNQFFANQRKARR